MAEQLVWKRSWYLGWALVSLALVIPAFVNVHTLEIIPLLSGSISGEDGALLIYTAARLVFLNTLRALPLYLGAFLVAQGLSILVNKRVVALLLPVVLVPAIYSGIALVHGISYDFGLPATLNVIHVLILGQMVERLNQSYKKLVVISLFLFGVQWLDVAPLLTGYGFGRGEISLDVKMVATFLEIDYVLNLIAIVFAGTSIIHSMLVSKLMVEHYLQVSMYKKTQAQEQKLQQLEVQAVQARSLLEVQQLAHDLKNPLTIIQGLAGLLTLKAPAESDFPERICQAADNMNSMISEILYQDSRRILPLRELIDFIRTQLLPEASARRLKFAKDVPNLSMWANKVRLSRALVNIIENGLKATENGLVKVDFIVNDQVLVITISDQGPGIGRDLQDRIWEAGFSTRPGATGLGLSFTQDVITNHNGKIGLQSQIGVGTTFTVQLPIYKQGEGGLNSVKLTAESTDHR